MIFLVIFLTVLLKKDGMTINTIYKDRLKIYKEQKLLEPRIVIKQKYNNGKVLKKN